MTPPVGNVKPRRSDEKPEATHHVLTGQFAHETNTFSKLPTGIDNFRDACCLFGDEISRGIAGTRIELVGVEEAAREYGWRLTHSVAAWATPSGKVTRDAWDLVTGRLLEAVDDAARIDGILLALHGAMVTEDHDDAEGALLAAIRERVGPKVPIAITLDLHANVTDRMAEHADIITAFRTYPHVDQVQTARRAAAVLERAMGGQVAPRTVVARRPMLKGLNDGRTQSEPMLGMLARAESLEATDDGVLVVSLHAGFALADTEQTGVSVSVTGDGGDPRYGDIAEQFMEQAWETRHLDSNVYLDVPSAIAETRALLERADAEGPIVVADFSDNPGAGAYGDSTLLLRGLIESGIDGVAFAALPDPEAATALAAAGEGAEVTISLGGKIDPLFGPPLKLTGTVRRVTDGSYVAQGPRWKGVTQHLGPTAVFRVAGVDVVVCTHRVQCTELETFSHAGIHPRTCRVVGVKSMHHFRAAYEPIARAILVVDAGALASTDYSRLPYRKLRRPIFPLDLD